MNAKPVSVRLSFMERSGGYPWCHPDDCDKEGPS